MKYAEKGVACETRAASGYLQQEKASRSILRIAIRRLTQCR